MIFINKLKQIPVFVLVLTGLSLNGATQTNLKFTYNCSREVLLNKPHVSIFLKDSNNKVELLIELSNDTILGFESNLYVPLNDNYYILSVQFESKTIGKEILDYSFTLRGNETDIEINVDFSGKDYQDDKNREEGAVEIIKYYAANPKIELQYLPGMKGEIYYRGPFFLLKNYSDDIIYGIYFDGFFWGTISAFVDSVYRESKGTLDLQFGGRLGVFPGLAAIATVGSFGITDELSKNRYKYTLLYKIDKNTHRGLSQYLKKNNFIWWAATKEYYRLIYEFEVK